MRLTGSYPAVGPGGEAAAAVDEGQTIARHEATVVDVSGMCAQQTVPQHQVQGDRNSQQEHHAQGGEGERHARSRQTHGRVAELHP